MSPQLLHPNVAITPGLPSLAPITLTMKFSMVTRSAQRGQLALSEWNRLGYSFFYDATWRPPKKQTPAPSLGQERSGRLQMNRLA
jgi:hypothetical protein